MADVGRPPTMADVARLAGVSVTTVSLVLNNRPDTGLRPETKERVRAAIETLGYRPNYQARALARRRSQTIGFVGERLSSPFAGRIISGAHDVAREHGSLLLILDAEDEGELASCVKEMHNRRVDGILIAAEGSVVYQDVPDLDGVPVVLVNCRIDGTRLPSILPDDEAGGRSAARLLIDAGHHRLACLAGDRKAVATQSRVRGFRAELAAAGIASRTVPVYYGDYRSESGYRLCLEALAEREPPTALFMGNDRMALGAYYALAELGLRVPEDVSVVGFDDQEELAESMRPGLTTMRLPHYEMGRLAAKMLFDVPRRATLRDMRVPCVPVLRSSVRRQDARTAPDTTDATGDAAFTAARRHLA